MKWWIIVGNVCGFLAFGVLAFVSYPEWIALFDAFAAGINLAAAGYGLLLGRAVRQVHAIANICDELTMANRTLIAALMRHEEPVMPALADWLDNHRPKLH